MSEIKIELLNYNHLEKLYKFELDNRDFFERVDLGRKDIYYEKENFEIIYDEYIYGMNKDMFYMYLIMKDNDIVGRVNIVEVDRENSVGEIGYRMDENSQGKGYATEAVRQLLMKMRDDHKIYTGKAMVLKDNIGSQKILSNNGFTLINEEKNAIEINGKYYDTLVFEKEL